MKLFRLKKPALIGVLLFVAAYLTFLSFDAKADSEMVFDAGSAVLRGETPTIGMNIRWPDAGPGTTDFEAGFHLSGESHRYRDNPNTISVYGLLVPSIGPIELGLGFALHSNAWEYTCQQTFALMAGGRWQRFTLRWYHHSSAGSCRPNAGRDFVKVGWRF